MKKIIGVLAIQGDFQAHIAVLDLLKIINREIRNPADLDGVTHLIIPGGESTTIRKVTQNNGLWDLLSKFSGPVMGTCMGSIMMANKITNPSGDGWGMIDMIVERNGYGRQINSFTAEGKVDFIGKPFEMIFIRAPKIIKIGNAVKPIAWLNDEITGVISGNKLALTFHPELSTSSEIHKFFNELN